MSTDASGNSSLPLDENKTSVKPAVAVAAKAPVTIDPPKPSGVAVTPPPTASVAPVSSLFPQPFVFPSNPTPFAFSPLPESSAFSFGVTSTQQPKETLSSAEKASEKISSSQKRKLRAQRVEEKKKSEPVGSSTTKPESRSAKTRSPSKVVDRQSRRSRSPERRSRSKSRKQPSYSRSPSPWNVRLSKHRAGGHTDASLRSQWEGHLKRYKNWYDGHPDEKPEKPIKLPQPPPVPGSLAAKIDRNFEKLKTDAKSPPTEKNNSSGRQQPSSTGKPEKTELPSTLAEYFRSFHTFKIPAPDKLLKTFCIDQGIKFESVDKTLHDHPLTAAYRWLAVRNFCEIVGRNTKTRRVLSWFGADRDNSFVPNKLCSSTGLKMTWIIGPNFRIQGDQSREFGSRKIIDEEYDDVLVCDVYQSGVDADTPLTPDTLITLAESSKSKCAYVIARKFFGDVGGDVLRADNRHHVEGTWYRTDQMKIVFRSDENSIDYSPHPDVNWLFSSRTFGGLDISVVNTFGPYTLLKVVKSDNLAVPIPPAPPSTPLIERRVIRGDLSWVTEKLYGFLPRFISRHLLKHDEQLVHTQLYAEMSTRYHLKAVTGIGLDALHDRILEFAKRDPLLQVLAIRYPELYRDIIKGTMIAIYFDDRATTVASMLKKREDNVITETTLAKLRGQTIEPVSSTFATIKIVGCVAAGVVLVVKVLKYIQYMKTLFSASALSALIAKFWPFQQNKELRWETVVLNLIVSPIIEEWLKQCFPWLSPVIAYADVLPFIIKMAEEFMNIQNPYHHKKIDLGIGMVVIFFKQILVHESFRQIGTKYGLSSAITLHSFWNAYAAFGIDKESFQFAYFPIVAWYLFKTPPASAGGALWDVFMTKYKALETLDNVEPVYEQLPSNDPIKYCVEPVQCKSWPTEAARGSLEIVSNGYKYSNQTIRQSLVEIEVDNHRMFPIVMSTAILYSPANTINNTIASIMFRIHKDPFTLCPPIEIRRNNWLFLWRSYSWQKLINKWASLIDMQKFMTVLEACEAMGKRGKRIWRSHEQLMSGCVTNPTKSYSVKWDETIPAKAVEYNGEQTWDIKPRAICKLDPSYHAETAAWSRLLADSLHLVCDVDNPDTEIMSYFCSGYTQTQLSKVFALFELHRPIFAVAGDDSICKIVLEDETVLYVEADFSMCDQSQDECPLGEFMRLWVHKLMLGDVPLRSYQESFSKPYVVKSKNFDIVIRGDAGWQLCTGSTATTIVNSLNNLALWHYVYRKRSTLNTKDPAKQIETLALELGFTLKVQVFREPTMMTFLKGWFVPCLANDLKYVWMPLPSAVVKVGKIMKNPLKYFKNYHQVCYMIGQSYQHIPSNLPILGPFFRMFDRLAQMETKQLNHEVIENFEFKTKLVEPFQVVRTNVIEMMLLRYSITETEINEIENLFNKINCVPVLYHHNAILKLRETDYC